MEATQSFALALTLLDFAEESDIFTLEAKGGNTEYGYES
jgi:hypothetical protein